MHDKLRELGVELLVTSEAQIIETRSERLFRFVLFRDLGVPGCSGLGLGFGFRASVLWGTTSPTCFCIYGWGSGSL